MVEIYQSINLLKRQKKLQKHLKQKNVI